MDITVLSTMPELSIRPITSTPMQLGFDVVANHVALYFELINVGKDQHNL